MAESTRPPGAPDNGDGDTDGTGDPVPPPTPAGCGASRATLFEALFRDRGDERLLREAMRRRTDLHSPFGLVLVCGPDCDVAALGRVLAGRLPRAVSIAVPDGPVAHAAVVLPVPAPPIWSHALAIAAAEAPARSGLVLPRLPVVGMRALRASYFTALSDAALAVALDLAGPLVAERELVVPRMLAALPAHDQELLLEPLRPVLTLPAPQRMSYVRTLDALHRHGGTLLRAAATLHVHPNTVRYRLARVEELTGMHLDDPRDRMRLDLAAMLVTLRGGPPGREDDFGMCLRQAIETGDLVAA